jgi:hypothetical protein
MIRDNFSKAIIETDIQELKKYRAERNRAKELMDLKLALIVTAGTPVPRVGNTAIDGVFTAGTFNADSSTVSDVTLSSITRKTNVELFIDVNSPLRINGPGSQENLLDIIASSGFRPIIRLTNGAVATWNVALETATASTPFVIRTGIGVDPQLRLDQNGTLTVAKLQGDGSLITNIDPNAIGSGTFDAARIPNLNASKITAGTLPVERGGTGLATLQANRLLVGNGTGNVAISGVTWDSVNARVGINDPTQALTVNGSILASGDVTAFSDVRLKSNIVTIDSALEKVLKLRGVYFTKDDKNSMGVIAQEVEKVIPEVVADNGGYKSVAYGNIVGLLIEAIKELKQEIEVLKNGN